VFDPALATCLDRLPTTESGEHPLVHHGFEVYSLLLHFFGEQPQSVSTAAVMHDLVEERVITPGELTIDFDDETVDLVLALTRRNTESYTDYIIRVSYNRDATRIKICDLIHNMRMDRLEELSTYNVARQRKYAKALDRLWGALVRVDIVE